MRTKYLGIGLVSILVSTPVCFADWLVLRDGTRLETQGPWKIDGPLVVFNTPGGRLASLRVSRVDLENSRQQKSTRPTTQRVEEPSRKKPVLVLTDADVARARPEPEAAPRLSKPDQAANRGAALRVDSWTEVELDESSGVEIIGTLRNHGKLESKIHGIEVSLRDETGRLQIALSYPDRSILKPGESTSFRVELLGVGEARGRPRFRIQTGGWGAY